MCDEGLMTRLKPLDKGSQFLSTDFWQLLRYIYVIKPTTAYLPSLFHFSQVLNSRVIESRSYQNPHNRQLLVMSGFLPN